METADIKPSGTGFKDLAKKTFDRWYVKEWAGRIPGSKDHAWTCVCKCGTVKDVPGVMLKRRKSRSCGCLYHETRGVAQTTHGMRKTPMYVIWAGVKGRCYSPGNSLYRKYGAKGVKVCERWRAEDGFIPFLEDMGERPTPKHIIDRKKGELHYSCGKCEECIANGWPANCQWVDADESAENRSIVVKHTLNGESMSLAKWARKVGMKYTTLRKWVLYDGMTLEAAITKGAK